MSPDITPLSTVISIVGDQELVFKFQLWNADEDRIDLKGPIMVAVEDYTVAIAKATEDGKGVTIRGAKSALSKGGRTKLFVHGAGFHTEAHVVVVPEGQEDETPVRAELIPVSVAAPKVATGNPKKGAAKDDDE